MDSPQEQWEQSLLEEVEAWQECLVGETTEAADRALRLSSNRMFPAWVKPLIRGNPSLIRVLDVGAGPITAIGDIWPGHELEITPIDPMAEAYGELLRKLRITPHTPTIYGTGESLVEQFGENTFDFVYACEVLDRALDPLECYRQMLAVAKPGCSIVTIHEPNLAEKHAYEGHYQWNFSMREGRLLVWNHDGQYDVLEYCENVGRYRFNVDRQSIRLTMTKAL